MHSDCASLLKNLELLIRKINHLKEVPIGSYYTKWILFVNKNFMHQPKPEYLNINRHHIYIEEINIHFDNKFYFTIFELFFFFLHVC